ncbi:cell wall metabolism sensor histidine kinase WalK [Halobacillus salinus]|uniref:DUF4083 domain-containing protein n=1 Tax=Halobacillus salinus TaxID=192814 RepID=A0A4Z0H2A6_9BACI|nr:cell wall metabolism sensor histidine kinase WalK [Halobacillus salinus]TGB03541.1 hypothetical protein E4663_00615 [Halobacillus salinus]
MFLFSTTGGLNVSDVIVQLVFLLILAAVIVGVITLVINARKRNNQLSRMEEKVDKLSQGEKK